jgi:AraC family transcriptional regulator
MTEDALPRARSAALSARALDEARRIRTQEAALVLRRALQLAQENNYTGFEASLRRAMDCLTQDCATPDSSPPEQRATTDNMSTRGKLAKWQVKRVESFVAANLDQTISVAQLARIANLSRSHFSRSFRQNFGQTPHLYISSRRIEFAKELMLATPASLGRIASECGLCDQPHFNRMFKRIVGMTPSAWRQSLTSAARDRPARNLSLKGGTKTRFPTNDARGEPGMHLTTYASANTRSAARQSE